MRRPILIALFALGTIGGYTSGFHHLKYGGSDFRWSDHRTAYEQHVAEVCTRAALDAQARTAPTTPQAVPVQAAPVFIVPPIQMIAPQGGPAPSQAAPTSIQATPAPSTQPGR